MESAVSRRDRTPVREMLGIPSAKQRTFGRSALVTQTMITRLGQLWAERNTNQFADGPAASNDDCTVCSSRIKTQGRGAHQQSCRRVRVQRASRTCDQEGSGTGPSTKAQPRKGDRRTISRQFAIDGVARTMGWRIHIKIFTRRRRPHTI